MPAAKPIEREEARRLRQEYGLPMKQIAARLGVSPASVYAWTRDIQISEQHRDRNLRRAGTQRGARWAAINRQRRLGFQHEGRLRARQGDALHQAGCMLYWAEGAKHRNVVSLCNSDVHMLRFFRRFLTTCFRVDPAQLRLEIHVYLGNGLSIEAVERYWLDALELPASCARKHQVNPLPTSSSGKKKNKLPYGVCKLILGDTRVVQHIFGAIQEYAGFEEPRWVDGPPRKPRPARQRRRARSAR